MNYKNLIVTQEQQQATITLNRPEKRNALSFELIDELLTALDEVESSPTRVLILTGAGNAFCAGMDLDNLRELGLRSPEQNLADSTTVARLFRRVYEFPKPTIAAVNGPAIAGGCGLATLCDITVAAMEATLGYSEVRIGFVPAIVSAFLVRQVGEKHARELLLTGRAISATEAHRMGLVNIVCKTGQVMEKARELANQLLQNSPASLQATKRLLCGFSLAELQADTAAGIEANANIRSTEDFREGITSFLEKRKPEWKGN